MQSPTFQKIQPYICINPDHLHEWNYRDLQRLCAQLGLGGRGKKAELVSKLLDWNRSEEVAREHRLSEIPMNVQSQNFAYLPINVREDRRKRQETVNRPVRTRSQTKAKEERRKSFKGQKQQLFKRKKSQESMSPPFLSPSSSSPSSCTSENMSPNLDCYSPIRRFSFSHFFHFLFSLFRLLL